MPEIRTDHLPNTSLGRYRYANPLGRNTVEHSAASDRLMMIYMKTEFNDREFKINIMYCHDFE
jgi:hypothetical protein